MKKNTFIYLLVLVFFAACKPEVTEFEPSKGSADFTTYVSIGNSLTSGFADGTLYKQGQINSYPNMLAGQFKLVGGGEFKTPYMLDELGLGGKRILGMSIDCKGTESLGPILAPGTPDVAGNMASIFVNNEFYNNVGVPGIKIAHLLTTQAVGNPYYKRFASNPGTSTILSDAMAKNPTFISLWIGNNDVLGYSTSGGDNCGDAITDPTSFTQYLTAVMQQITVNNAKGVISTIPYVTSIPYFTTVPYNGLVLVQAQADGINAAYAAAFGSAANAAALGFTFTAGQNAWVIQDSTKTGGIRRLEKGELLLLTVPQDSMKCAGWGSQKPIPHKYVLDSKEITKVKDAVDAYNVAIKAAAEQYGWALADMNVYMTKLQSGIVYDGVDYNASFVTGGAFSLDGVHPNPRGYALIANEFIRVINAKFAAKIPTVDVNSYPGVVFP